MEGYIKFLVDLVILLSSARQRARAGSKRRAGGKSTTPFYDYFIMFNRKRW